MTFSQRQAVFDRFFHRSSRANVQRGSASDTRSTIRKLPPPPLPGESPGATLYFLNAVAADGRGSGLVALGVAADAALRRAEKWVQSGKGSAPFPQRRGARARN